MRSVHELFGSGFTVRGSGGMRCLFSWSIMATSVNPDPRDERLGRRMSPMAPRSHSRPPEDGFIASSASDTSHKQGIWFCRSGRQHHASSCSGGCTCSPPVLMVLKSPTSASTIAFGSEDKVTEDSDSATTWRPSRSFRRLNVSDHQRLLSRVWTSLSYAADPSPLGRLRRCATRTARRVITFHTNAMMSR